MTDKVLDKTAKYISCLSTKQMILRTTKPTLRPVWPAKTQLSLYIHPVITKTCLYNFDPLKPHFYMVKMGFTEVYNIFLISAQKIDCGYSLEPPRRGGSNEYPQSMFWVEIWKISEFFIWKISFFGGKIFSIFEYACFRNGGKGSRSSGFGLPGGCDQRKL